MKIKKVSDVGFKDFLHDWGATVYSVKGMGDYNPKGFYSQDWIEENGLEVSIPERATIESTDIQLKAFTHATDAMSRYITLRDDMLAGGQMVIYDEIRRIAYEVAFDGMTISAEAIKGDKTFLAFDINFINTSGIEVPPGDTGSSTWGVPGFGIPMMIYGTTAPAVIPDFIGQFYIKTSAPKAAYIATGTSSVSDWLLIG